MSTLRRGRPTGRSVRSAVVALAAVAAALAAGVLTPTPAQAARARINGSGSSYVALALQQWVADGQTAGLEINYLPTGSPQGLTSYGQSLVDFAATEAEFSALQATGGEAARGFQYVPDVAGATAVLYNVQDKAGRKVDYLHLSPRTIARIFTGDIARWSDPAISADNKGLQLPDEAINVVYRAGQSGTTGTFYDFIANVAPDIFGPWAARHQFPTGSVRIIQLDSSPGFAPKTQAFNGSDQIAQHIASGGGLWSIGYDEFGYAKTYRASTAWVQNASGEWVLPYAENISAALESARLRPDLSQDLTQVYSSTNPKAYPISAYSYLVTQCPPNGERPTCKGAYSNPGITETLATWMRYIACDGQINMARIGYSPLPPNLSQELVNSIARMQGTQPEQLSAANCSNPRFHGSLGDGAASPPDPLSGVESIGPGPSGGEEQAAGTAAKVASGPAATTAAAGGAATAAGAGSNEELAAAGRGGVEASGGGSGTWRRPEPIAYAHPPSEAAALLPVLLLAAVVVGPPLVWSTRRRRGLTGGSGRRGPP